MLSMEEIKSRFEKAYERWNAEDDAVLKASYMVYKQSKPFSLARFTAELALRFNRKPSAVRSRLKKFFPEDFGEKEFVSKLAVKIPKRRVVEDGGLELVLSMEMRKAYSVMEDTKDHIFLTGRAGTGKSTLLQYFKRNTKKNVAVVAPTGIAALNVQGQTIHSFCSFSPATTLSEIKKLPPWSPKKRLIPKLDTLVIDEVSMVRSDLLDCVDKFLRLNAKSSKKPFGGVQIIFVGDLFQLPPVVRREENVFFEEVLTVPYFFGAAVMREIDLKVVELSKIYRQEGDEEFIEVLNAVRVGDFTNEHLEILNTRVTNKNDTQNYSVYLATTNSLANTINARKLAQIPGMPKILEGRMEGKFTKDAPVEPELQLKVGAQVMMLNNDKQKRWYNGTLGKIVGFEQGEGISEGVRVHLESGKEELVFPYTWESMEFAYNEDTDEIETDVIGSYTQYPMKLAWAFTIHKSQGKTFERVIVDFSHGTFAHGQAYVALSRCRSLAGLTLMQPITKKHIIVDEVVLDFLSKSGL